ncbi:MAG TPA: protoporphyrinogen oxidase [Candidatus Binataceae bacterium]|nr:protoporphyrinogen oxidase [Candidatus Binataceae bacterium]
MRRVVIIGGGVSGLAAAWRLRELMGESVEVLVLEGSPRLGGVIRTEREGGFLIEAGADSFVTDKPWGLALTRRLGLENQLLSPGPVRRTLIVNRGKLREIPAGFNLLAPARLGPLLKSPILSMGGKLRLLMEPLIPRRRAQEDESLAAFVKRRLGREVLERLAQPLAGGIYAADPEVLSLQATLPRFPEMEQRYGSVIRALRARAAEAGVAQASGARWSLFVSFESGMQTIIDALAVALGPRVRRDAPVREIVRGGDGRGWCVFLRDGSPVGADAVICTASAPQSARLLGGVSQTLAAGLVQLRYSSIAVVNLAYQLADFPVAPNATGFVVPRVEGRHAIAGSFSSIKFSGRAPTGQVLLRLFVGGSLQPELLHQSDEELSALARRELRELIGVTAQPLLTMVTRWNDSMPQYGLGHQRWAADIQAQAQRLPGLALAGAAYGGVGISDCIHGGELAAEATVGYLQTARSAA